MKTTCKHCGETFFAEGARGRTPTYCSHRCRQAAYRARVKARPRPVFPEEMIEEPRWTRADGKRPIRTDGRAASSVNPATWTSYSNVQQGPGDGYGFMLGGGYGCIDLDHCLTGGKLTPLAARILKKNPEAFVEISTSGTGLHVFGLLPEAVGRKRDGIEVYSVARFIKVTGNVYRAGQLVDLKV